MSSDFLYIKKICSSIRCKKDQRDTLKGLGLRKIGCISKLKNTASIRGMIFKVQHLIYVIKK